MSGKGSNRRPQGVDEDTMASNWDRVFGGARPAELDGTRTGLAHFICNTDTLTAHIEALKESD